MNRRGFLSSLIAVPAAAYLAPSLLAAPERRIAMSAEGFRYIQFKGVPITFDECAPANSFYFVSREGVYWNADGELLKLST